jgi:uncharacterized protein YjiS (DUF1127 family)
MSTMGIEITTVRSCGVRQTSQVSMWNGMKSRMKSRFAEWRRRARSRAELARLDEAGARDLGLSRCDISGEAGKSFWEA